MNADRLLKDLFQTAVDSALPPLCLPGFLPAPPSGRTIVIGAGKASAAMAQSFEQNWRGSVEGTVITRYGFGAACQHIDILEAGHPIPDDNSVEGTKAILSRLTNLTEDDLVIVLLSGGASALLTAPAGQLTLQDKAETSKVLLQSGAPIGVMNCIRKHLSAVKGGQLALAAAPARVLTLSISDVPGDDPAVIGSGPTVPDPSTREEALDYIDKYKVALPKRVMEHLRKDTSETPKPDEPAFARSEYTLIATPGKALEAAKTYAEQQGLNVVIWGDDLEGEARDVAAQHAARIASAAPGTLFLSGGELTVTAPGDGRGGPNTEYALALAIALDGARKVHALACDTDGIDGTEDNAGAIISPDTLVRAQKENLIPQDFLSAHNSYAFFQGLNDLIITGPTMTNVNDFRAILVT